MGKTWTTRCNSGPCVFVTEAADGFAFTSTIPGNDGSVTYTAAETAEFLAEVKAGNFDDLHRRARVAAGTEQEASATA
jgi:hypothetical protein